MDFEALAPHWNGSYRGVYMLESVPKVRGEGAEGFLTRAFEALTQTALAGA